MPLYEYLCQDCGSRFDVLRSMREVDAPAQCKSCLGKNTVRQLSVFFSKSASSGQAFGAAPSSGGCAGCSGGSCGTCHH